MLYTRLKNAGFVAVTAFLKTCAIGVIFQAAKLPRIRALDAAQNSSHFQ